ncbi:glutathione S-transferase T3-like isoform X2 [Raphanus sativus]|uniref:Glutathione S-transferase T3-like isoform X2 n=1 Tax=Raphanus sativus TaxID=3726 RepID=A0A9W3DJ52_RAPSA|nr:glutathione S-transferase T3-like isoform X2 [Raphanus sativus]
MDSNPFLNLNFVESSPIPLFGTQATQDANLEQHSPAQRKERRVWTATDDLVLISAWLNTSKDAIVSNEQKCGAFWKRIADYMAASPKLAGIEKRAQLHCKNRWHKINDQVCKFCGAYEAATRAKTSGQNDNDVLKEAHVIYFNRYNKKFSLEHAWKELRYDQKWCLISTDKTGKKRKGEDEVESSTSHATDNVSGQSVDVMERPPGVKAAKRRGKKPLEEDKEVEGFHRMWEVKEEDWCRKEKQAKIGLLDRLLAKTEPLADYEETLKKKLIAELF